MRLEMFTITGTLTPSGGEPDQEAAQLDHFSNEAPFINQQIEEGLRNILPGGNFITARITFRRGSIHFELLIWILNFAAAGFPKIGAFKIAAGVIEPILAKAVNSRFQTTTWIPHILKTTTQSWEDDATKRKLGRLIRGAVLVLAAPQPRL
jgi:hypothetical protein